MSRYRELAEAVIEENRRVLEAVAEAEIGGLIEAIEQAKTIQLFALGRMQASLRAFAMRLKHMGFDTHVVFDTTAPAIGPGDLLIVNAGVTRIDLTVIRLAREAGARVCVLTAHPENENAREADLRVFVPGQIFGTGREIRSIQPMAALLEQSLFLLEDIVVMLLMEKRGITPREMQQRHTNLEGVMGEFA
jgi:6-phospho-3-hexuloisomerase